MGSATTREEAIDILAEERWNKLSATHPKHEDVVRLELGIRSLLNQNEEIMFLPNGDFHIHEVNPMNNFMDEVEKLQRRWEDFGENIRHQILSIIRPEALQACETEEETKARKSFAPKVWAVPQGSVRISDVTSTTYVYECGDVAVKRLSGFNLAINVPGNTEVIRINDKQYTVMGMRQSIFDVEELDGPGVEVINVIELEEIEND